MKRNVTHHNAREGIDVKIGSANGTIEYNEVYDNGQVGLYVDSATNVDVFGNVSYRNRFAGIALGIEYAPPTRNIRVFNNVLYSNQDGGISFFSLTGQGINDCEITNNTFYGNEDAGLWFLGAAPHRDNTIVNNIFPTAIDVIAPLAITSP